MSDSHALGTGARHRNRLLVVFAMVVTFMVVEFVAGVLTGSLALISDAGHMATDALGIGMALAAITAASRVNPGGARTFGLYRLEILAALANAVLLFAVAGYVIFEAIQRIGEPQEIVAVPMLVVAALGLGVNLISWWLLREGAGESLNVEGAFLEVIADMVSSIGVVVAGVIVLTTGWTYADPVIAGCIGLFILPRAWKLGRKAIRVLLQSAPDDVDVESMGIKLAAIPGVVGVHDLHVWVLTSGMPVASAHLATGDGADPSPILAQARQVIDLEFGIDHATVQVEDPSSRCAELSW